MTAFGPRGKLLPIRGDKNEKKDVFLPGEFFKNVIFWVLLCLILCSLHAVSQMTSSVELFFSQVNFALLLLISLGRCLSLFFLICSPSLSLLVSLCSFLMCYYPINFFLFHASWLAPFKALSYPILPVFVVCFFPFVTSNPSPFFSLST